MYFKSHLGSPQLTERSSEKANSLSSLLSWSPPPTTTSDPLQTLSLTQPIPNPITPQTRPPGTGVLIILFFLLIISAFGVLMLLFFLLPIMMDYWEAWLDGKRNVDWRRRRKVGERRRLPICQRRKNACGAGARVLEYGSCVFTVRSRCALLGRELGGEFDLERGDCKNGEQEGEGRRCRNGKVVRFVEEVEVVEFGVKDVVMLVVWDDQRKTTVGLKRGCEVS